MTQITAEHSTTGYVTERVRLYDGRHGAEIDLGLANSPIGPASELAEPLRHRDPIDELSRYPTDPLHTRTRQLVLEGIGLQNLSHESLLFVDNGSYGAGDEVMRYLKLKGYNDVIVPAYSFPNVAQWAERHDIGYRPIVTPELDPLRSLEQVLTLDSRDLSKTVVYIDYPNNPFGVSNPHLMREVVEHVSSAGGVPFVDLAFGEVLGPEFTQAIQFTVDHGGVCLGSLSKTQGLPGLRTGYAVLPPEFTQNGYGGSQRLVFGLNNEAEFVYDKLFDKNGRGESLAALHARRVSEYNTSTNLEFYQQLADLGLIISPTDLHTQIQVVIASVPDFYQRLAQQGVVTESLKDYGGTLGAIDGYGDSAVRILTPKPGTLEEVVRRIELAIK